MVTNESVREYQPVKPRSQKTKLVIATLETGTRLKELQEVLYKSPMK